MATFIFTYDLIKNKDYPKLWGELERLGGHRALNSFWLLSLNNTAKEVLDHLKGFVDEDDKIWVSELTKKHWYDGAKKGTNQWIKDNPPAR